MDQLNRTRLEVLAGARGGPHVSIYMPLSRRALHDEQNEIRLKNALNTAAGELARWDAIGGEAGGLLAPARRRLDASRLARDGVEGLAVLIDNNRLAAYGLPCRCPDLVVVGERFHLKPLMDLVFKHESSSSDEDSGRVAEALGGELAGVDIREIVPAACNGRIDTLLLSRDDDVWGRYDRESESVRIHRDGRRLGDEDLLDLAAVESLLSGARVQLVDRDDVPGATVAAAVYRYPRI
jgi:hypothetical protein